MKKYRFDRDGDALPNGSVPVYTDWEHGPTLAGVRNCPVQGKGVEIGRRTVYVQGEMIYAGAWDGRYRYHSQSHEGRLASNDDGFVLHMGGK